MCVCVHIKIHQNVHLSSMCCIFHLNVKLNKETRLHLFSLNNEHCMNFFFFWLEQLLFISRSLGDWKSEIRVPSDLVASEGPLPRLLLLVKSCGEKGVS